MSHRNDIQLLLDKVGAQLIRQTKHKIYRLPNGKQFAMAATPGSRRNYDYVKTKIQRLTR